MYDLNVALPPLDIQCLAYALGVEVKFVQGDILKQQIPPTDLLFIDTFHSYAQLKRELGRMARLTRGYILMHDTTVDGDNSECVRLPHLDCEEMASKMGMPTKELEQGLWQAIEEFLTWYPEWELVERRLNNNGLTVLRRIAGAAGVGAAGEAAGAAGGGVCSVAEVGVR